jgi:putative membrane protein
VRRVAGSAAPDPLTEEDSARVTAAITAAESRTTGEIRVVILTRLVARDHVYPLLWAALAALVLPWLAALVRPIPSLMLFGAQVVTLVVLSQLLRLPFLERLVVPYRVREAEVRDVALTQFLALGIHQTRDRTGLLILVALKDRIAEVVADQEIHARVGHDAWRSICRIIIESAARGALADGLATGIEEAGRVLETHFPPREDDVNELPNHLTVI